MHGLGGFLLLLPGLLLRIAYILHSQITHLLLDLGCCCSGSACASLGRGTAFRLRIEFDPSAAACIGGDAE